MNNNINISEYEKDRVIGYDYVMSFLGCSRGTACKYIKKANQLMNENGKALNLRGKTTLYFFYKCIGITSKVI